MDSLRGFHEEREGRAPGIGLTPMARETATGAAVIRPGLAIVPVRENPVRENDADADEDILDLADDAGDDAEAGILELRDDAAIEPPPAIGSDERRMHVRAYNFWAQLLKDGSLPAIEDLDLANLGDFGDHAVLLDFTAGLENPGVSYLGKDIQEACGLSEPITRLSDVPGRSLLSRLTDHYLQIIANQAPIGFEAEFQNERGANVMYRGILLPFSSDGDMIDFILGVINWKEAAGAEMAAALEQEVTAAVLAVPAAPMAVVPVPAWADGPDSQDMAHVSDTADALDLSVDESDEPDAAISAEPGDDAALAEWLAAARRSAAAAHDADVRGRGALYRAIGRAYDFSLIADAHPQDYAALLAEAGLKPQERAPMTPVIKLIFGSNYDKTRITEYATVVGHARSQGLGRGTLAAYLDRYEGGLKALVKAERAAKRGEAAKDSNAADMPRLIDALRLAPALGFAELNAGDNEFVLLVGRKVSNAQVGVVAALNDPTLLDKVLRKLAG